MKINPDFNFNKYGIGADEVIAEAERLAKQDDFEAKVKANPFPIDAFPIAVQQIITETNESLSFPIDFISCSLMYAGSLAIGNTTKIEAKRTWYENAVLYIALVGQAGTNKSHPLSFALGPLEEQNKRTYKEYEQQKQEYEYALSLSKKERENEAISEPVKPVWKKYIVSDVTPEGLGEVHKLNKRGIGLYSDELAGWFKNFNRYNSGSEETFWLSSWSGKPINIDRKTGEPVLIHKPFIPVIGTIQNGVLKELSGNNRNQNGFIDRILFAIPDQLERSYWSEKELDNSIIENWRQIISNLLNLPCSMDETGNPDPEVLQLKPEAKRLFVQWFNKNTDLSNASDNEVEAGINAKLTQYTLRFSLILQLMSWACGESDKEVIGVEAIKGAIKLAEYFRNTALKVHRIVANPLEQLPEDKQRLYKALPELFATSEGLEIAKSLTTPERTFKRFLNDKTFFRWLKQGSWEKKI